MRTLFFIIQKEFRQIFRNKSMLPIIFVLPIVQLLVLIQAVTFDLKQLNMVVVDNSRSSESRELVNKFVGSSFFVFKGYAGSSIAAQQYLDGNEVDLAMIIPPDFSTKQVTDGKVNVQFLVNAINTMQSELANAYASSITREYNEAKLNDALKQQLYKAEIRPRFWYNPTLNYKFYMIPGILVVLVTAIGLFLSGMNIVREKELGTIEQLNVTPIKKWQFMVGKILPFLVIGLLEITIGILLGRIFYGLPIVGSLLLLYFAGFLYLLVVISLGSLISTISGTQQQSMFVSWFFMMMFLMMSGLFNIVESMPQWAISLNVINPIAYFIKIVRMVMLKGSTIVDIAVPLSALGVYALVATSMAIGLYQKRS